MRSENDILDNQLNEKQYEIKLYFNIILNNFKQILHQKFPQFDYSKKGRINRIQLALLLRQSLNCSPLHYINDTQLLLAIHSTFNLYFSSERQQKNKKGRNQQQKSPILIQQRSIDPSSPIFDRNTGKHILSDGHSISLSECISVKHLVQHKINGFLQEIIQKPYPKSGNSVSIGTDQSCSSGSYYIPCSGQFSSFQTPKSFAVETRSNFNQSPLRQNIQQQQVESIAEGLNRLSHKIGIIDIKFYQYDIYKQGSLGLEAVILLMKSYIFPELSDFVLYQIVENFIYDRKNRLSQQQSKSSYSPKFTALKKDQLVRLVVDNINQESQESKARIDLAQETYDCGPQSRSYSKQQDQNHSKERPLTMCDIQGGSYSNSKNVDSPKQLASFPPQKLSLLNQGGQSVATFKDPLEFRTNPNEQTVSRRSLFKINRANIQQNLKKFSRKGNQPIGNKFLQKIQSKMPNSQFQCTNQTFSNQNYCYSKEEIDVENTKEEQNNTSAILQQRVLQMQNHISQVKQQTTKLKQKLQQKLTPKIDSSLKQDQGIMIPKDLLTSLISANQKSNKKQGSQKKKKKSRGSSSSLSSNNNNVAKNSILKASASQAKLPSGHLVATPIEPVYMTKKGGGALIMKKRNTSFSPSSAYNNIHHANKIMDKFYVLQKSPDKIYSSPIQQYSARKFHRTNREDLLNYSTIDDISYSHNMNRPCKSRYCLVCREKFL